MNASAAWQYALERALEDPEAGLLQYADVVIVGVAHRPAGGVPARLLAVRAVHLSHVAVRPLAPGVVFHDLYNREERFYYSGL